MRGEVRELRVSIPVAKYNEYSESLSKHDRTFEDLFAELTDRMLKQLSEDFMGYSADRFDVKTEKDVLKEFDRYMVRCYVREKEMSALSKFCHDNHVGYVDNLMRFAIIFSVSMIEGKDFEKYPLDDPLGGALYVMNYPKQAKQ